jgi:SOS response regulatory protein OraA/RecX
MGKKEMFYRDARNRLRHYSEEEQEVGRVINGLSVEEYAEASANFTFTDQDKADMMLKLGQALNEGKIQPEEYREAVSDIGRVNALPLADRVVLIKRLRETIEPSD